MAFFVTQNLQSIESNYMQQELDTTKNQFRQPVVVDMGVVSVIPNEIEAVRQCMAISGLTHKQIAIQLDMDEGHLSRCLSAKSKAHFPPAKRKRLQIICGNWLVNQWIAFDAGFELVKREKTREEQQDEYIAELEARLAANG